MNALSAPLPQMKPIRSVQSRRFQWLETGKKAAQNRGFPDGVIPPRAQAQPTAAVSCASQRLFQGVRREPGNDTDKSWGPGTYCVCRRSGGLRRPASGRTEAGS